MGAFLFLEIFFAANLIRSFQIFSCCGSDNFPIYKYSFTAQHSSCHFGTHFQPLKGRIALLGGRILGVDGSACIGVDEGDVGITSHRDAALAGQAVAACGIGAGEGGNVAHR